MPRKKPEPVDDTPEPMPTVHPPPIDWVIAGGYSLEEAEKIVAEEQRKFDDGEAPYPRKVGVVESNEIKEPEVTITPEPVQVGQLEHAATGESW